MWKSRSVLTPYTLGEEAAIHTIRALHCIVQGFISLEMAVGFAIPLELDTSFHRLVRLYTDVLENMANR